MTNTNRGNVRAYFAGPGGGKTTRAILEALVCAQAGHAVSLYSGQRSLQTYDALGGRCADADLIRHSTESLPYDPFPYIDARDCVLVYDSDRNQGNVTLHYDKIKAIAEDQNLDIFITSQSHVAEMRWPDAHRAGQLTRLPIGKDTDTWGISTGVTVIHAASDNDRNAAASAVLDRYPNVLVQFRNTGLGSTVEDHQVLRARGKTITPLVVVTTNAAPRPTAAVDKATRLSDLVLSWRDGSVTERKSSVLPPTRSSMGRLGNI